MSVVGRLRRWLRTALGRDRRVAAPLRPPIVAPLPVVNGPSYRASAAADLGVGRRVLDRRAVEALAAGHAADERLASRDDPNVPGRPVWNDGRPGAATRLRNLAPRPRPDGHRPRLGDADVQPRSARTPWRLPDQPPAPGSQRRRLPGLRQTRPDLHVINGEGTGTTSGRRARLRPVENPLD